MLHHADAPPCLLACGESPRRLVSRCRTDVFDDCAASWKILENQGIMIMDDFFWRLNESIINSPAKAIVEFLDTIQGEYKILKLTKYQISIKKI